MFEIATINRHFEFLLGPSSTLPFSGSRTTTGTNINRFLKMVAVESEGRRG